MSAISSYPSIFALGHRAVSELLTSPVVVEEKIDGSQISFRMDATDGSLRVRSKGIEQNVLAPDKLFAPAIEVIQSLPLLPGWTYRGEYLAKPKHNVLAYARIPVRHIILFDVETAGVEQGFIPPTLKAQEAARLGLEVVPTLYEGIIPDAQRFRDLLTRISCLGGPTVEGVVVKNYALYGPDKKVLMAKFVSETFKEVHATEWKRDNPSKRDVVMALGLQYQTPARWAKAVQHLREAGRLEDSPRDIGLLIREVPIDIEREEADVIKDALYKWAWPQIQRMVTRGLPEWYKAQLFDQQPFIRDNERAA